MFQTRKKVDEGATIESVRINHFSQPSDEYCDFDNTFNISLDSDLDLNTDDYYYC
jgi:hypothetical protein